jgi:hypothetical protein
MTATTASTELKAHLQQLTDAIGPYPHAELTHSNATKKQGCRLLKVVCECGCVVRMTRKWLDEVGPPKCGCGAEMAEESINGEDDCVSGEGPTKANAKRIAVITVAPAKQ